MAIIPFPTELRPRLPTIVGNVDYQTLRLRLQQIDALLIEGLEFKFVELALEEWLINNPSARQQQHFQLNSRRALRCTVLRTLLQEDYRGFSVQLAGNPLYQWFCLVDAIDQVRVPSKSQLERYDKWMTGAKMEQVIQDLLQSALNRPASLQLKEPLDLTEYFLDTTCLEANIHFPVDWVLLRDGVRTLMKATVLIREQGLKSRMESPQEFLTRINRLSIDMTHQSAKEGSKKHRKAVLRSMKQLVKTVRSHAQRHRDLLDKNWEQTGWTRAQAQQILNRIDQVQELLPRAQDQAHERIIGERPVKNDEKILSLYEADVHVLVRGKAGANVEFGNTLLLGENRQGIILDFKLYQDQACVDSRVLFESLTRVWEGLGRQVQSVGADRGFFSAENSQVLKESETFDGLCPRNPEELAKRMEEPRFVRAQRRRSQTEGRIGILKGSFLGQAIRAKGFEHREVALAWGVLTHNLWMLAKLRDPRPKQMAAAA